MATIFAHGLNEKTKEKFKDDAEAYFQHTFNPNYSVSYQSGTLWISNPYGEEFKEEYQREKLSYFLEGLKEGIDYRIEIE